MIDPRRFAPATLRNRTPILAVLRDVLPPRGTVLEVASGSGEHAVFFADALPDMQWMTSDPDPNNRASIAAWVAATGIRSVCGPLALDATDPHWPLESADAVVCINMIHVAPWAAAEGLLSGAARILGPGAPLVIYGPFRRDGAYASQGDAAFDASLRAQDPALGLRDLTAVVERADRAGFDLDHRIDMPANNLTLVFRRKC